MIQPLSLHDTPKILEIKHCVLSLLTGLSSAVYLHATDEVLTGKISDKWLHGLLYTIN